MSPITTDDPVAWSVCMSVCMSVTLMHPANAVGRNEMPFGRDTGIRRSILDFVRVTNYCNVLYCNGVVPSITELAWCAGIPQEWEFGDQNPQFAAKQPISEYCFDTC